MALSQFDLIRSQAEAAAKNAASGAAGRARRGTSLVNQASRLAGKTVREGEKTWQERRAHVPRSMASAADTFAPEGEASAQVAADGYVRRSPVQPLHEAADYRRRLIMRAIGIVALLAAVLLGMELLTRLGLFGR